MKKVMLSTFVVLMISCTVAMAQTVTTSPVYKTVKLSNDMTIQVPVGEQFVYEYQIDANDLIFNTPEDRERYFNSINDEVVSYRYDKTTNTVYMVLDRNYIEKNKWTTTELNTYFIGRSTYMKDQYGNYILIKK